MIAPGEKLDVSFRLKVWQAGEVKEVAFRELLTRPTIVSVYMKNKTPTCDRQNASLARDAAELDRAGFNVIALSRDTCGSHARYAAAKEIPYVLASDPDDRFARAADSLVAKQMYGRAFTGPARAAFVIDRDGTVLAVAEKVDAANHGRQLRELIKSL
jgi:thioredoxin-dependent peroxiredoxin